MIPPGDVAAPRATMDFPRAVYEVARKDFLQHLRTKRLLIIGAFLVLSLWVITVILPISVFDQGNEPPEAGSPPHENSAFRFYMNASVFGGNFFIQLLAIVLTADAVCSEWQNRTIFLLLSKPVPRSAFVLGKLLGSLAALIPAVVILFSLQYLVLQPFYEGAPSGEDVARFFGFLGILVVGASAVASVSLFFSALTRTQVQSLVLTLMAIFVVFPLVGNIGDFVFFGDAVHDDPDAGGESVLTRWKYDWSHYFSPERTLTSATDVLIDGDEDNFFALSFVIPQFQAQRVWLSIVSGGLFTVAFTLLSMLVVGRRNFE